MSRDLDPFALFCRKTVNQDVVIGFSGAEDRAGESRLIRCVREIFGFEAASTAFAVGLASFAWRVSILEKPFIDPVGGVKLDGGLIG